MKALHSWMQEFAPLTGEPDELAATMTDLGMVVEDVATTGPSWDGIVVAKVLALRSHPEADKIQLVDVDAGDGEPLQICCGAFNMAEGDLVPLATLGTVMPGGLEIARRKLRGEWSNGMICSSSELELGEDADGIMILDSSLPVGETLASALGAQSDVVFDLDIEGNRPDALSVIGITRDLAARIGVPFSPPTPTVSEVEPAASSLITIDVQDGDLCPRFGARVLENVSVGDSPAWMASRLIAAGMRPINSIVDISNYVMLELGQPNHTYDLGLVKNGRLGVRMGRAGESIITLDEIERPITPDDGVIVDADDTPIGLAGVMGGASTEISDATTSVLLEAAVWDRMTIAKTSRRLGLRSEASTRFERGVDPLGIERALDRFAELAIELCGAKVAAGHVVVDGNRAPTTPVTVRVQRTNDLLNTELSAIEMADLLDPIGFTSELATDGQALQVTIPSWRPDSSIEIDVIEEIARHNGYDKSGKRVPTPEQAGGLSEDQRNRRRLRRALLGAGFSEAMPIPFLAPNDLSRAGLSEDGLSLVNPLVVEESILRTSLLPGLLKALVRNQAYRNGPVRLYELGVVFEATDDTLPNEPERVAVIGSGFDAAPTSAAETAVGWLYDFAARTNMAGLSIANEVVAGLHPTRSAVVSFRGRTIGSVGEIDPAVLENYSIDGRVAWFEVDVAPVLAALSTVPKYKRVSVYPSSDFDLAFVTSDEVPATDLSRTMKKAGDGMIESVELFDVFRSEQLGPGVRSLAYRLRVQALDRTLTDEEVAKVRQACIDQVGMKHKAEIR